MKDFKYRFNKFIVKTDRNNNDESVWYNSLTGAIVSIKDYEEDNIFTDRPCDYANYLLANYFLVPEDFNEDELIQAYRDRHKVMHTRNYLNHVKSFTIMTTTKCNARCFYCYQLHNKGKQHMTLETAEKVVDYMLEVTNDGDEIFIGWFGGEPLYNYKVMDMITTRVASANRIINSSIITNGYLFDEHLCNKAIRDWRIHNVQVTLDGTEEVYNEAKNFIYKDSNAFKVVINNIHSMLRAGLRVSVRMNVGMHNIENLKELINYLAEEFKGASNFSAYVHELFDDNRTEEVDKATFEGMMELKKMLTDKGLFLEAYELPPGIKVQHCMVDDGGSVIITPDGRLGLCEHYENEHFIGNIEEPTNIDMKEVETWKEMSEYTEICEDCPYKPACLKCKLCPDHKICSPAEKEYNLYNIRKSLIAKYNNWEKDQCKGNSCKCR